MANNQAWSVAFYSATVYISIELLGAFWGTEYLQARGLAQSAAANIISLCWLGYAIACPLLGVFSDIAQRRKPTLILCAFLGLLSTAGITYLPSAYSSWTYSFLFFCLGFAASGQNLGFAAIVEHSDVSTKAIALGLNNGIIILSAAIVPPLASYFIYLSSNGVNEHLQPENFIAAFTIMPLLYACSLIIACFCIRETYCIPQQGAILLQFQ